MNARDIQHALFNHLGGSSDLMIPNYTPAHWFECDLYRITKSGYAEEFEVKISAADFRADALKGPTDHQRKIEELSPGYLRTVGIDPRTKHERLEQGDQHAPSRFWFALPEELAAKVEVPQWAGLIVFRRKNGRGDIRKPAPRLHKQKADPEIIQNARGVFYYRYWNIRLKTGEKAE